MNAANEVAVEAFLKRRIRFNEISDAVSAVMCRHHCVEYTNIEMVLEADAWSRQTALDWIGRRLET
jgi:1-deoxy-D-xylulose-5-phosphate reductoisomerase